MTREDLKETYSTLNIRELLEILDNEADYTPLAIEVAAEEVRSRELSESDIADYEEYKTEQVSSVIRKSIADDLSLLQKNLFFFIWFPLLTFPFRQNFKDDGYVLKLKQANYYSIAGFIFFVLTGIFSVSFGFTDLTSLGIWVLSFLPAYFFDELFNRASLIEQLRKELNKRKKETADQEDRP